MSDNLYIIIPAYNESETIREVAEEWHQVVAGISADSRLVIIDDGSKDNTYEILCGLQKELPQLLPVTKPNGGHGATILYGYRYALEQNAAYIFQTDSDGQTLPSEFGPFWENRKEYAVQIGHRNHREDGFGRIIVTKVLKFVLLLTLHVKVTDANTPYRLMDREVLAKYLDKVPEDYNLTNVVLSVMFVKGKEKIRFIPITFRPRQGGVNSINIKKIFKIGLQAVKDFRAIRKTI